MSLLRPHYIPAPYQDSAQEGRMILRDGSTATVRLSREEDRPALQHFFAQLTPESRRFRFFSETKPGMDVIDTLCGYNNGEKQVTLIVTREEDHILATGSYLAHSPKTAEFAVAVDDVFQGNGLGGLLLERMSVLAATNGFVRFVAITDAANRLMLEVFRHSGFEVSEKYQDGYVQVEFSVLPREQSVARSELRDRLFTRASMDPIFHTQTVAVLGESADGILNRIDDCALRGVRAVVVTTAGFAEAGDEGATLQRALVGRVRGYGMRLVGPRSLGVINTDPGVRLNVSSLEQLPREGRIAIAAQSAATGREILELVQQRDIGISYFIGTGNKADVTGNDLLQYWEDDPRVGVILLCLDSFGNPRRFARIARRVAMSKPVVCWMPALGNPDEAAVDALLHQAGVVRVRTLAEMMDVGVRLEREGRTRPASPGNFIDFDDTRPQAIRELCRLSLAKQGPGWLSDDDAREALRGYGIGATEPAITIHVHEDLRFGPLMRVIAGTQALAQRITPLTDKDAEEMAVEAGAKENLREQLLRVSLLVEETPEITELEWGASGARIRVAPAKPGQPARHAIVTEG